MSRIAEGTLQINVRDSELDTHVQKLGAVKKAWTELAQGADALKNMVPQDLVTDLKRLGDTMSADIQVVVGYANALRGIGQGLTGLATKMNAFTKAVTSMGTAMSGSAKAMAVAGNAIKEIARVFDTELTAAQTNATAEGLRKVGSAARNMSRGFDHASDAVDGLTEAYERARAEGVPLAKVNETIVQSNKRVERSFESMASKIKKLQQDFIRFGATLFIAFHWLKGVIEKLNEGAQQIDLENTLTLSIKNFEQTMTAAREATRGTVSELEMMKSAALMSSFGLPMENFAEQMGMVQKMAVRTGQSTEYLMESLARGVSRLSPMILDNLGLQISLSDAYNVYAASVGKAASALTKAEQKQAVMNEVMAQSKELTKEVDLANSKTARMEQSMADMTNTMRDAFASVVIFLSETFQKAEHSLGTLRHQLKLWKKEMVEEGTGSVLVGTRDLLLMTDPGRLSKGQVAYTGIIEGLRGVLGLENARTLLGKEQLENLEKQAAAQNNMVGASRRLFNLLGEYTAGETKFLASKAANAGGVDHIRLIRNEEEQQELMAKMEGLSSTGAEATREKLRARYEELELENNLLDITRQRQLVYLTLARVGENQAAIREGEKRLALEDSFVSAQHKKLALQEYGLLATQAMNYQTKELEDNVLGIAAGLYDGKELLADEVSLQNTAYAVALLKFHVGQALNKQAIERLKAQDLEIVRGQLAAVGQLEIEYQHAEAQKELNEKLNEYNKLKANSITLGKGELSATDDKIKKAGDEVRALQDKTAGLKEVAKYQKMGLDAAHDVTILSKKEREHLAFTLAGNRTRAQVEAQFLELRKSVLNYEKAVADILNIQNMLRKAGMSFAAGFLQDSLEKQRAALAKASEEAGRATEMLKRFSTPSTGRGGGGGGGGDGEKKDIPSTFFKESKVMLLEEEQLLEGGRAATRLFFKGMGKEFETSFDENKKEWTTKLASSWEELMSGTYDISAETQWSDLGTFTARPRAALEEIQRMAADVAAYRDKLLAAGALTPVLDQTMDTMLSQLEGRAMIVEKEIELLDRWSNHANDAAAAMKNAFSFAGDAQFFGREINNILDNVTEGFERYAEVLKQNEYNTYDLFTAAMPVMRATTQAFIKDKRQQAGVEMVMQAAAAWAAWPNMPKVATHIMAAGLYGSIAGGAVKLPSGTQSSATKKDKEPVSKGPLHIHLYGDSIATSGERGQYLEQIMAEARAEGRV